ncbi:uncharacterized protein LOC129237260 [Anastrepha obliqua]|uniref:uncharacterized protein LOC129237260 n=1 Tax=Anastrepha obliqua TaxID=95512 RepID=UPI0024098DFF|nr:uncharacterized protein LOC129237260 [Anastrepha obliqua]XP_054727853.1 uncharacterized protein LOC129237260 [Anastrepha obliqua]XP_054727854.1 uncharacterized protein LOC129237260 [Anastrepha obliqua]XP_054727855.1 uncharacterized protein LOC129237260 [Anastrepha obliqua]XP_054727856.1 uncharacterized protein LOC129237260 [Anastrepha obliqua]XP_054727857.1 uncharacterized protein LOC129237260 [Anastrepha obliqua]XP_054727858.1 uncharacterized protein LOC129237260 [Anastrepha obliqua]XP_0
MSTSETRSEIVTSDEEDFKPNIPYNLDDVPITSTIQSSGYKSQPLTTAFETLDTEEDDPSNNFNCQIWENDDGFMDDNISALDVAEYDASTLTGSNLATPVMGMVSDMVDEKTCRRNRTVPQTSPFQTELSSSNFFQLPTSISDADADAASSTVSGTLTDSSGIPTSNIYNENIEQDIKYSPSEMILEPPSITQYHYNFTLPPSHVRPLQPPVSYGNSLPQTHHGTSTHSFVRPHAQPQQSIYSQYPQSSSYHANMWYPNAPHGSASGYYRPYAGHRYPNFGGYPHDPMLDMLQLSNSGREARNRAEKNRRDKLNRCIQELSTMVPHVAESPKRVDKTTTLRLSAHYLRVQYIFGESLNSPRPQYTDSLMEMLDRFFIALTCHGQIVLISSSVEQHLGHCQTDLYGQNILNITHPEDQNIMKQQLIPTDLEQLFDIQTDDDSANSRPRTKEEEEYIDKRLRDDKRNFTVRLARAGPRSEPTAYEIVNIEGNFRRSDAAPRGMKINTFPSNMQMIRRSRGRDDAIPLHTISGNDIVLIATARIIRLPKVINSVTAANSMEYKTRHLIDGSIIDCDQRIGLVAGYMTNEVCGLSPFTFMHQDDVRWVIVALRQMYDCYNSSGESTYRLITRNGHFIYLRSKGYLEVHKETKKVHSFICINTLLDEEEGKRRIQEMKNKFSMIVNTKIPQSSVDEPASKNPQQLEKAVLCLIQNLQKSPAAEDEDDGDSSTESYGSEYMSPDLGPTTSAAAMHRYSTTSPPTLYSSIRAAAFHFAKSTKTPSLALVPPETSSVKTSISKSVSVVNITAAKHLHGNQQQKSTDLDDCESGVHYDSRTESDRVGSLSESCSCQSINADRCQHCQALESQLASSSPTPTSAILTTAAEGSGNKRCGEPIPCTELKLPKRPLKSTEIEHVLSSSLDQLGKTLDEQLNAAIELRDKSSKYEMPNSSQRIEEIMEEHQIQSKIYVDIKSEYEVQKQNKCIDVSTTKGSALVTTLTPLESHCNQQLTNQKQQHQLSDEDNDGHKR